MHIPGFGSFRAVGSGELPSEMLWQDYYHSHLVLRPPTVIPRLTVVPRLGVEQPDPPELQRLTWQEINQLRFRTATPQTPAGMENEVSRLMFQYRDYILSQLSYFPNVHQQHLIFKLMWDAADGLKTTDSAEGRTLLHYMAMNDVADLLRIMVEAGFEVNAGDSDHRTPLHLAVIGNHADAVQVLVEKCGANANLPDLNNLLPWHYSLVIDMDNFHVISPRVESKKRIIRFLAIHTDLRLVRNIQARLVLAKLKNEPQRAIEIDGMLLPNIV